MNKLLLAGFITALLMGIVAFATIMAVQPKEERVSVSINIAGLPATNPNEYDDESYFQATTDVLPSALRTLWGTGITAQEFEREVQEALENFVSDPD